MLKKLAPMLALSLVAVSTSALADEDHAPLVFRAGIEGTAGVGVHFADTNPMISTFAAFGARGQLGIQRGIVGACLTLDAQSIYGPEKGVSLGLGIMNDYTFLDDHFTIGAGVGFGPRVLSGPYGTRVLGEWWPDLRIAWNPIVTAGEDNGGYRRKALVIGLDLRGVLATGSNVFFAPFATIGYQAF